MMRPGMHNAAVLAGSALLVIAMPTPAAMATKIGDITHLQGTRTNKLVGIGLVTGLNGKGDGGKFMPMIRPLAQLLANFSNPSSVDELKESKNVALVMVDVTLPENGVREGDSIDVSLSAMGAAKSLLGGRLFLTPLQGPSPADRRIYALAGGKVEIPDPAVPTRAVVYHGATMERDVIHNYIMDGTITLVISDTHASWAMASTIAQLVNEDLSAVAQEAQAARVLGPSSVVVTIPMRERADPAAFIARIESLELLMPAAEARVVINRTKGTIVVTGDVEIAPMWFSQAGMTIQTSQPPPQGTAENPVVTEETVAALDSTGKGGAKLKDLVAALNRLRVPPAKMIDLVETMCKTGRIHGKLVYEE